MEIDQVAKNLKACEKALEGTEHDLRNVNVEKIAVDKKLDSGSQWHNSQLCCPAVPCYTGLLFDGLP